MFKSFGFALLVGAAIDHAMFDGRYTALAKLLLHQIAVHF